MQEIKQLMDMLNRKLKERVKYLEANTKELHSQIQHLKDALNNIPYAVEEKIKHGIAFDKEYWVKIHPAGPNNWTKSKLTKRGWECSIFGKYPIEVGPPASVDTPMPE